MFRGFEGLEEEEWGVDDEGWGTATSEEQERTQREVGRLLGKGVMGPLPLRREEHVTFLLSALEGLSPGYAALDSSKPWLCYWIAHALDLLAEPLPPRLLSRMVLFLRHCQCPTGGFAGGPQQLPHLAPTFAAVSCLAVLGSSAGWDMVDRPALYRWLLSLKNPDGSFSMHRDGEADVRATYCALAVARLLQLETPELLSGVAQFVARCQTHEGGISGYPGNEAHGGYTFCGTAAAALLGCLPQMDCDGLLQWVAQRQMRVEGGFSGRVNKLVDSCYSYWQGAVPVILHRHYFEPLLTKQGSGTATRVQVIDGDEGLGDWGFDQLGLQKYLLICCQNPRGYGGMIDKPGKTPDLYHTCYALSGLSLAQNNMGDGTVLGPLTNRLNRIDPVHNVKEGKPEAMIEYFRKVKL